MVQQVTAQHLNRLACLYVRQNTHPTTVPSRITLELEKSSRLKIPGRAFYALHSSFRMVSRTF